jgi:hypothetical protein
MTDAATISLDVTPAMAELLRAGAADARGLCCSPGRVEKNFATLHECEKLGFIRFLDIERPWITDKGRAAIGEPSGAEASLARLRAFSRERRRLEPEKRADPRTDFDYRAYKSMNWVCTLAIRQPDPREKPQTIRVGKSLHSEAQYLGGKNSIVQPESEGRFVLTLVPNWMTRPITKLGRLAPAIFSSYPLALDPDDPDFTEEERALWDRLRNVCFSVNSRIRNAGRRPHEKRRFGEYA